MHRASETRLILFSSAGSILIGALGLAVALASGSGSVFADGLFSFLSAIVTLLSIPVLALVERGGDDKFHFGYASFEPLYVVVSSLVILGSLAGVGAGALRSLAAGGAAVDARSVLAYEAFASAYCLGIAFFMKKRSRTDASPILAVEAASWFVDGCLSAGILLAFLAGRLLGLGPLKGWTDLVDPVVTLGLVVATAPAALSPLAAAFAELLSAAPRGEIQRKVEESLRPFKGARGVADLDLSMEKIGRSLNVHAAMVLDRDLRASELAVLERDIDAAIRAYWPDGSTDFYFDVRDQAP